MINLNCKNNFYSKFLKMHKTSLKNPNLTPTWGWNSNSRLKATESLSPLKTSVLHVATRPGTSTTVLPPSFSSHRGLLTPLRGTTASIHGVSAHVVPLPGIFLPSPLAQSLSQECLKTKQNKTNPLCPDELPQSQHHLPVIPGIYHSCTYVHCVTS